MIASLALTSTLVIALVAAASASPARPLVTALAEPNEFSKSQGQIAFDRAARAGTTRVVLVLYWRDVAPGGSTKPSPFQATDPASPLYNWESFDRQVRLADAENLDIVVEVHEAPEWAQGDGSGRSGSIRPSPYEFGLFARAAAERYSGTFDPLDGGPLPRIRFWQAWNEPNLSYFLSPSFDASGRAVSPGHYLQMLNKFATAIHDVNATNVVIAGGTAPFANTSVKPLRFMRAMLCLTRALTVNRECPDLYRRAQFDVWSHHPYTSGGPTDHAYHADNVSIGDLPEMRRVLRAGIDRGRVVSASGARKRAVPFWVTEFGWDTNPPDSCGVPAQLHARWTAEALYRMWAARVTFVTWYPLYDQPKPSPYQTGLYYSSTTLADAEPKPARRAFRFPFVAFKRSTGIFVWGRTPFGMSRWVVIERRTSSGWRRVGGLRADAFGIFSKTYGTFRGSAVRARIASSGEYSRPFSLTKPRDFEMPYGPFGC